MARSRVAGRGWATWELADLGRRVESVSRRKASKPGKVRKMRQNRTGWPKRVKPKKKGFSAFAVKSTTITPEGKELMSTKVKEPTTGIHSRRWAGQIVPQTGFLSLAVEIRHRIYRELLSGATIHNPRKKGLKFTTTKEDLATFKIYHVLALVCRQTYVDVVGGGLLYSFAHFSFTTGTMMSYFSCINPAHKDTIKKISLSISLTMSSPAIPALTFTTLGSLPKLSSLEINVIFSMNLCRWKYGSTSIYARALGVMPVVMSKLEEHEQWEAIKGMREFKLSFQIDPKSIPYGQYGRTHFHRVENEPCTSQDLQLANIITMAREIVTQKRAN